MRITRSQLLSAASVLASIVIAASEYLPAHPEVKVSTGVLAALTVVAALCRGLHPAVSGNPATDPMAGAPKPPAGTDLTDIDEATP